jgi:hypothetical protein
LRSFYAGRPQLHIALGWWTPEESDEGALKVFDGQHKAAVRILLGVKELPVRVFVEPDLKVLLQANTNAGDTLAGGVRHGSEAPSRQCLVPRTTQRIP